LTQSLLRILLSGLSRERSGPARRWRRNHPGNAQAEGPRRPRNAGKQGVSACALAEGARRSPSMGWSLNLSGAKDSGGAEGGPWRSATTPLGCRWS